MLNREGCKELMNLATFVPPLGLINTVTCENLGRGKREGL